MAIQLLGQSAGQLSMQPASSRKRSASTRPFTDVQDGGFLSKQVKRSKIVNVERTTPTIPRPQYTPGPYERLRDYCVSWLSPVSIARMIKEGSRDDISYWIDHGGNLDYLDTERNSIPHLLAIGKNQHSDPQETRDITRLLFQYYPQEHMERLCTQNNIHRKTPWHELTIGCMAGPAYALRRGGLVIAEEMINAGVSPLVAVSPKRPEDFPAVSLLTRISGNSDFLRKLIDIDTTLTLRDADGVPSQLHARNPTLLWATVNQRLPEALRNMLLKGVTYTARLSPTYPLTRDLGEWHIDSKLRSCAKVLCEHGRQLESNTLHADLMKALSTWEKGLHEADSPHASKDRKEKRDAIIESFGLLLRLIPEINDRLTVLPPEKEKYDLADGLLDTLNTSFPLLFNAARKMPDIKCYLKHLGYDVESHVKT